MAKISETCSEFATLEKVNKNLANFQDSELDSLKVDLTETDLYYFQCKATENTPAYHKILEEMPQSGHTNVILHKRNNKGVVAVMRFDDFLKLIKK